MITKFFEYSHARLPIVVSDVKTMAEAARATGQGEVFRAQDVGDYVRAVQTVLADPGRYRAAYTVPGLLEKQTWHTRLRCWTRFTVVWCPGRTIRLFLRSLCRRYDPDRSGIPLSPSVYELKDPHDGL